MQLRIAIICAAACLLAAPARAQDPAQPPDSPPTHTLHVYTNLIQLPVLVLSPDKQPVPPIDPAGFAISLNGGHPFRATHVRPEADDPITLAILLEIPTQHDLHARLADSLAALAHTSLHPGDRIALYSFECNHIRAQAPIPADPQRLRDSVEAALHPLPNPISRQERALCSGSTGFLNAVGYVTRDLATLPGRRVLLAFNNGFLQAVGEDWETARSAANNSGIAVFALAEGAEANQARPRAFRHYEDPLTTLCELTGGLVLHTPVAQLPQTLKLFVKMLRERYILEFPRPPNAPVGRVELLVTIAKRDLFIRPSGVSVPIAAPEETANPAAPPPDPATAPQIGSRRPLSPPR